MNKYVLFRKYSLFMILLLIPACFEVPSDFNMPEWDVDLRVPIASKDYYLDEILEDYDFVSLDSTEQSVVFYFATDTLIQKRGIGEFLEGRLQETGKVLNVPIANGDASQSITMSDGLRIDSAYFRSGDISMNITNNSTGTVTFLFTFPGFIAPGTGNPLTISETVAANSSSDVAKTFANYAYTSSNQDNNDELVIQVNITAGSPGGTADIIFNISNSVFEYVRGVIPTLYMDALKNALEIPLEDDIKVFRDKTVIKNPEIFFRAYYHSKSTEQLFDVMLQGVKVDGVRNTSETFNLTGQNGNENLGDYVIEDRSFDKHFTNDNSNLTEFIQFLPDSIIFTSDVIMNPDNKSGTARIDDSLEFNLSFRADSYINVDHVQYKDTVDIDWDADTKDYIQNGRYGDFVLELSNSMPITVEATMYFCDADFEPFFQKEFSIEGAPVNDQGFITMPMDNTVNMVLDSAEIYQLSISEHLLFLWEFSTSEIDSDVALRSKDWFSLKSYCTVKYHLDP